MKEQVVLEPGSPDRDGSVTLIGAVSPSGGDFTEPVTTHTMRFIKTFWALDANSLTLDTIHQLTG